MSIYVWIGIGIYALLLLGPRIKAGGTIAKAVVSVVATVLVIVTAATQINLVFAAYPTVGIAFGHDDFDRISLSEVPGPTDPVVTGDPTDTVWKAPEGMPIRGRVTTLPVPGTISGFSARDAQVYLPPSYFTNPRPLLPVLVLMAGQPGKPEDWLQGGKLTATMDAFARDHEGLAPVVVIARWNRVADGQSAVHRLVTGQGRHVSGKGLARCGGECVPDRHESASVGNRRALLRWHLLTADGDQLPRGVPDIPRSLRSVGALAR